MNLDRSLRSMAFMMNVGGNMAIQMCGDIALICLTFYHWLL